MRYVCAVAIALSLSALAPSPHLGSGGCQPVDSANELNLSVGELTACYAKSVLLHISGRSRKYRSRDSGGDGYRNQPGAWCNDSRGLGHAAFLSRAGEQPGAQHRYHDIGHLLFVRRERPPVVVPEPGRESRAESDRARGQHGYAERRWSTIGAGTGSLITADPSERSSRPWRCCRMRTR